MSKYKRNRIKTSPYIPMQWNLIPTGYDKDGFKLSSLKALNGLNQYGSNNLNFDTITKSFSREVILMRYEKTILKK